MGVLLQILGIGTNANTSISATLVDTNTDQADDIVWLKAKVADLEDRSKRNNLKVRGIPESITMSQLPYYVRDAFLTAIPTLFSADLTIDCIYIPASVPRDVLLRVHFLKVKEQLLNTFRSTDHLPEKIAHIQLLPDFSKHTLQLRQNLQTVTKELRNHKVAYQWRYLATLLITHQGNMTRIASLEDGLNF